MIQTESPIFGLMLSSFRDKKFSNRARGKGLAIATRITRTPGRAKRPWIGTAYLLESCPGETTPRGRDKAREFIISGSLKVGKRGGNTRDTRVENERFTDSTRYFIRSMTNIRYLRKQTFDCTNEMLVVMIDRISHE